VFIGGFGALYRLFSHSNLSMVSTLSWLGFAVAIMVSSAIAVLQSIDGIALKFAVDAWTANTSSEDKKTIFRDAEGIRWIEYGTNSIFRILQGVVSIIFGIAIAKSMLDARWMGMAEIIIGAITIAAGV
jgi:hypothetical protein